MKREGDFLFEDYNEEKDSTGHYSYDDAWFDESSFVLNKKLRTMSLCFSMASFPTASKSESRPSINAERLLSELFFDDIEVNDDFLKEPGVFSLGLIAAQKKINDYSLIALNFRGASYGLEWMSNTLLGESGLAYGFEKTGQVAVSFLKSYLDSHRKNLSGRIKLWVSGYSRAAAFAEYVGVRVTEDKDSFGIIPEDIFVYSFESPMLFPKEKGGCFKNIHNTVNPKDMVPMLAPVIWGFSNAGVVDTLIPNEGSSGYEEILPKVKENLSKLGAPEIIEFLSGFSLHCIIGTDISQFNELCFDPGKKRAFFERALSFDQAAFLKTYMRFMASNLSVSAGVKEGIESCRKTYFAHYQESFSFLSGAYLGAPLQKKLKIRQNLIELSKLLEIRAVKVKFYLNLRFLGERGRHYVEKEILDAVIDRLSKDPDIKLKKDEAERLEKSARPLIHYFVYCASIDIRYYRFFFTGTFLHNILRVLAMHAPELTLSFMQAMED